MKKKCIWLGEKVESNNVNRWQKENIQERKYNENQMRNIRKIKRKLFTNEHVNSNIWLNRDIK